MGAPIGPATRSSPSGGQPIDLLCASTGRHVERLERYSGQSLSRQARGIGWLPSNPDHTNMSHHPVATAIASNDNRRAHRGLVATSIAALFHNQLWTSIDQVID